MKVLWITNIALPEALELLTGRGSLKSSGGWLIGAAEKLCRQPNIHLTVATVSNQVKQLTRLEGKDIIYYLLPIGKGNVKVNHDYEFFWKKVQEEVKPDVVHLHGTEFSHGLAYLEACGSDKVCVSIQGLTSAYYYYYYGLTQCEIRKAITPLSIIRGGILKGYERFKRRGEIEKEILRRVHHIIGRTSWDKERTWAINPNAQYHYGGETLRADFYSGETWKYDNCTPHTIFLSQAFYPIKGLHMVLRAMPLVLQHYPDAKLRVAGPDISRRSGGWKELIKLSDYGMVIRKQIKKYHLESCITFTGALDGDGMRREYLNSNVFVCPSSIENSPNSLGEAQLLSVPVIASYVGGIPDMMKGDEAHLYRFEEVEMLAYKICELFKQKGNIDTEPMRQVALQRHNAEKNVRDLLDTYKVVVNN